MLVIKVGNHTKVVNINCVCGINKCKHTILLFGRFFDFLCTVFEIFLELELLAQSPTTFAYVVLRYTATK